MSALIVVAVVTIAGMAAVVVLSIVGQRAVAAAHSEALEALRAEFHAEVGAREDLHERHLAWMVEVQAQHAVDLRAEREQLARHQATGRAPDAYMLAERTARIPDDALGEAEVHRSEMLAGRRRERQQYESAMIDTQGEAIVPVGAGG